LNTQTTNSVPETGKSVSEKNPEHMVKQTIAAKVSRRNFLAMAGAAGVTALPTSKTMPRSSSFTRCFRFAAASPPRGEHMFPSDNWLQAVAKAGYTHCIL
jgi:hypothetical protein